MENIDMKICLNGPLPVMTRFCQMISLDYTYRSIFLWGSGLKQKLDYNIWVVMVSNRLVLYIKTKLPLFFRFCGVMVTGVWPADPLISLGKCVQHCCNKNTQNKILMFFFFWKDGKCVFKVSLTRPQSWSVIGSLHCARTQRLKWGVIAKHVNGLILTPVGYFSQFVGIMQNLNWSAMFQRTGYICVDLGYLMKS